MFAKKNKTLVLYYERDPNPLPQTLYDRILCWRRDPRVDVKYVNVAFVNKTRNFHLLNPDIIILDTTLLRRRWNKAQRDDTIAKLRQFSFDNSIVVATPHDECRASNALIDILNAANCDLVLSCADAHAQSIIYGGSPSFDIEQTLTTHISPRLRRLAKSAKGSLKNRRITICYRANTAQLSHGAVGQLKDKVGIIFKTACENDGINCDIEIGSTHLLKTKQWQKLLRNSQAVLGVPSGASIQDPDGKLEAKLAGLSRDELAAFYGNPETYFNGQYKALDLRVLSARHIEAALSYTPQILVRGSYNNLLIENLHYIPIEPGFSNISSILKGLKDLKTLETTAQEVARHILDHPEFDERFYRNRILTRIENRTAAQFNFPQYLAWTHLLISFYKDKLNLSLQRLYQRMKPSIISTKKSEV